MVRKTTKRFQTLAIGWMLAVIVCLSPGIPGAVAQEGPAGYGLVIHGGAGTISRKNMTPEREAAYRAKLTDALEKGQSVLTAGGSALNAVEAVINLLEDSPLFNAGKGAVFTAQGTNELDASIMDGRTRNAGAVAGVRHIRNPISLARLVMEKSPHVMLSGDGAEIFAGLQGMDLVPQSYFFTRRRWESLRQRIRQEGARQSGSAAEEHGTVGTVALDRDGNLAAGTSTGGMTYKQYGRIGDSPVIGAGTYANNKTCAVSATGYGEYFIRNVVSYDISAQMEYRGLSLREAAAEVIMNKLPALGGTGGVIAIDANGNIAMPFNTSGMYRGYALENGTPVVKIYRDE